MASEAKIEVAERRILVVDDDPELRFLLANVLYSEGYVVDLAATHAEAEAQLEGHQYALVIADWRLPDGQGTAIAEEAAELGAKAIVMTGYLFQMEGGNSSLHETLMKPVRPNEIVDVVRRLIGPPGC